MHLFPWRKVVTILNGLYPFFSTVLSLPIIFMDRFSAWFMVLDSFSCTLIFVSWYILYFSGSIEFIFNLTFLLVFLLNLLLVRCSWFTHSSLWFQFTICSISRFSSSLLNFSPFPRHLETILLILNLSSLFIQVRVLIHFLSLLNSLVLTTLLGIERFNVRWQRRIN